MFTVTPDEIVFPYTTISLPLILSNYFNIYPARSLTTSAWQRLACEVKRRPRPPCRLFLCLFSGTRLGNWQGSPAPPSSFFLAIPTPAGMRRYFWVSRADTVWKRAPRFVERKGTPRRVK